MKAYFLSTPSNFDLVRTYCYCIFNSQISSNRFLETNFPF